MSSSRLSSSTSEENGSPKKALNKSHTANARLESQAPASAARPASPVARLQGAGVRSSSTASVFGMQVTVNSAKKQSCIYPSIPSTKDEFAERVTVVRKAFQVGVPKFNSGKYDVSKQAYSSAVIKLMPGLKGFPQGRMLFRALALSKAQQDCYASWTLKLALDALVDQARPGRHPIHLACGLGPDCVEIVLSMLHASKDYCHLFPEEGSPLAKAAPGILDLNTPTEDADALTPLLIACQTGNMDAVGVLLQARADVNVVSPSVGGVLDVAFQKDNKQLLSLLLRVPDLTQGPQHGNVSSKLVLSKAKLNVFPERVVLLGNSLTHLDLSCNDVSSVPTSIVALSSLALVNFSSMKLRTFPKELFVLPHLTSIDVSNNLISLVPPQIDRLTALTKLDISANSINGLPVSMGAMTQLTRLEVFKNPLASIPVEVIGRGTGALLQYLSQLKGKSTTWKRIKLMIVGEEATGKTSLLSCMTIKKQTKKGFKKRNKETVSTDGLSIGNWQPDTSIEFQTWDFGGQEIFYPTHQFFLSSRCIYIVVFNAMNLNAARPSYWIRQIRATANDRPRIFLVGTHADDPECTPLHRATVLNQLQSMFNFYNNNIVNCVFLSTHTGEGVKEFVKELVTTAKAHNMLKQKVPGTYALLDARLQKEKSKQVARWGEYLSWASACSVPKENIEAITQFLHDVGALIHFENTARLKDIVILDPQWLADVFASLVTFKHLWVKNGILNKKDLPQVWKNYPRALYDRLLLLLTKFGVMHPIESERPSGPPIVSSYIVPPLLPSDPPPVLSSMWTPKPSSSQVQFGRLYRATFTIDFSKLLINLLHSTSLSIELYWKNGALCRAGKHQALLRLVGGDHLEVSVRLPQDDFLENKQLFMLRHLIEMTELLFSGFYPGTKVATFIPCCHCLRSESSALEGIHHFDADEISAALASGSCFVHCRGVPTRPVNIHFLAPDLAMTDFPAIDESRLSDMKKVAEGGFGIVYKALVNGTAVAVKELKISEAEADATEDALAEFQIEVYIMSCLRHPCLVGLYGICVNPLRMVIEWCPEGDLWHLLRRHEEAGTKIPERLMWRFALDIARGMRCLHQVTPPIVHRDLRSPNIFLVSTDPDAPVCAKVADFGLSRHADHYLVETLMTWPWLAPEAINIDNTKYDERSDIYSFGIIMWELACHKVPYSEYGHIQMLPLKAGIVKGTIRPTLPEDMDPRYVMLMRRAWRTNPRDRVTFDECVKTLSAMLGIETATEDALLTIKPSLNEADGLYVDSTTALQRAPSAQRQPLIRVEKMGEKPVSCLLFVPTAESTPTMWLGFYSGAVQVVECSSMVVCNVLNTQCQGKVTDMVRASEEQVWVACSKTIQVWHAEKHTRIIELKSKTAASGILCMAVSLDGIHVWAGSSNGLIAIWKVATHSCVRKIMVEEPVLSLALVEGRMWAGQYKQFRIFDLTAFRETAMGASNKMHSIVVVGDCVWGAFNDSDVRVWSPSAELLATLPGHTAKVSTLAAVGNNVWTGSFDTHILIWDAKGRTCIEELSGGHGDTVTAIAAAEDMVWTCGREGSVCVWSALGAPVMPV